MSRESCRRLSRCCPSSVYRSSSPPTGASYPTPRVLRHIQLFNIIVRNPLPFVYMTLLVLMCRAHAGPIKQHLLQRIVPGTIQEPNLYTNREPPSGLRRLSLSRQLLVSPRAPPHPPTPTCLLGASSPSVQRTRTEPGLLRLASVNHGEGIARSLRRATRRARGTRAPDCRIQNTAD